MILATLGGSFPDVVRATSAVGVWQKVNEHTNKYTWITYGLDQAGDAVFLGRASGIASLVHCDQVNLTYALELFEPAQDTSAEPPLFGTFCGTGTETRMDLVQAPCPDRPRPPARPACGTASDSRLTAMGQFPSEPARGTRRSGSVLQAAKKRPGLRVSCRQARSQDFRPGRRERVRMRSPGNPSAPRSRPGARPLRRGPGARFPGT
jgi:hypothetical protein